MFSGNTCGRPSPLLKLSTLLVGATCVLMTSASCLKKKLGSSGPVYTESQLRAIKGVQVSTTGYETTFKIPLFQLIPDDRRKLFNLIVEGYVDSLDDMKKNFQAKRARTPGLEKIQAITEHNDEIRKLTEKIVKDMVENKTFSERIRKYSDDAGLSPGAYNYLERQNMADTYLIPQVFCIYVGASTKYTTPTTPPVVFSSNVGILFVAQAFMNVTIDNHTKKPKVDAKGEIIRKPSIDLALYVVPGLVGVGVGANVSAGFQYGFGVGLGPIDNPHSLNNYLGTQINLDAQIPIPLVPGGLNVRTMMMGHPKKPPLFFFLFSNQGGVGGGMSATIAPTAFLDPYSYLLWAQEKMDMGQFKSRKQFDGFKAKADKLPEKQWVSATGSPADSSQATPPTTDSNSPNLPNSSVTSNSSVSTLDASGLEISVPRTDFTLPPIEEN